jgi:hypothetical protein
MKLDLSLNIHLRGLVKYPEKKLEHQKGLLEPVQSYWNYSLIKPVMYPLQ